MIRLTFLFVCVLGVVPPALANRVGKDPLEGRKGRLVEVLKPLVLETPPQQAYRITAETDILLNGRPCRYEEVPADAVILRMEIASSTNKEILKVHFHSKTGPMKITPRQAKNRLTPVKKPIP